MLSSRNVITFHVTGTAAIIQRLKVSWNYSISDTGAFIFGCGKNLSHLMNPPLKKPARNINRYQRKTFFL